MPQFNIPICKILRSLLLRRRHLRRKHFLSLNSLHNCNNNNNSRNNKLRHPNNNNSLRLAIITPN